MPCHWDTGVTWWALACHQAGRVPRGAILQGRVYCLLNDRDRFDLHHIVRARQASDDEQRAWGIGREALLTDLPYGGGVVEVGDIRRRLHNIVERATYGLDGGLQVMPYLSGLGFGVTFAHDAAIRGSAHLSGDVGGIADLTTWIGRAGTWCRDSDMFCWAYWLLSRMTDSS